MNNEISIIVYNTKDNQALIIDFTGEMFINDYQKLPSRLLNAYPIEYSFNKPGFYIFNGIATKYHITDIEETMYIYNGIWNTLSTTLLNELIQNGFIYPKD